MSILGGLWSSLFSIFKIKKTAFLQSF